jgi:hypothetical protein
MSTQRLSRVAREPVPLGQHQLAQQYRSARAAHVKSLQLRAGRTGENHSG